MKKFAKITILVKFLAAFSSISFAQSASISNRISAAVTPSHISATFTVNEEKKQLEPGLLSKEDIALLNYLGSEQYVIDNLISLKESYSIPDIYFDPDQSAIRIDAQETLNNLADLLTEQLSLKVAITAHCDSRVPGYNDMLSLKRAKSARDYLVGKGIDEDRIIFEKHGRLSAVNPCTDNPGCSIIQQQRIRNAEFNIIVNGKNIAHLHNYDE